MHITKWNGFPEGTTCDVNETENGHLLTLTPPNSTEPYTIELSTNETEPTALTENTESVVDEQTV